MNKLYILSIALVSILLFTQLNITAKRMQFVKQKHFCYTKGKNTSTIDLNYFNNTKFIGELTVSEEGNDDSKTVGIEGTDAKGVLTRKFNDTPTPLAKGLYYSKKN